MFLKLLLGILIGVTIARWSTHRRWHRWHQLRRGPWRILHGMRSLRLDGAQRAHVRDVMVELGRLRTEMRFARFDAAEEVAAAVAGDTFDRARLDGFLDRQHAAFQRTRAAVLDHMAALHATLTPEQRTRLRDLFDQRDEGKTAADAPHPYR